MNTLTCHTDGCGNGGVPVEMDLTVRGDDGQPVLDEQGQPVLMGAICGPCGQPITDITDAEPEPRTQAEP